MADRPILFSAPMVRALLAGTKTQTRRVVDIKKFGGPSETHEGRGAFRLTETGWQSSAGKFNVWSPPRACPYGVPGDVLWVKETWQTEGRWDHFKPTELPDSAPVYYVAGPEPEPGCAGKTRVSLHMQRRFSRIELRITDVRVERLRDISAEDAIAEGVVPDPREGFTVPHAGTVWGATPQFAYFALWSNINGPASLAANPWTWAVTFERTK